MTFLALCFFLYFAPAILASSRNNPDATAIWFLNFFLGWTGIGWLVCLIWTISVPRPVLFYPAIRYIGPLQVPGRPPGWRSTNGQEDPVCLACYRPLPAPSPYCMMCGAVTRRSA